jgi:antitoxin component of MazEF toxin-antitoxin module
VVELRKLYSSGDSLVVAIPREWLRALKWGKGMLVRMELRDHVIVVEHAHVEGERAFLARKSS